MPEETPPDDVHLDLFYGVPAWLLALLLAMPGRGPLRNLVAELHQEHRGGYMSIALIVAPRMAGKLYNVAAIEAPMTKPYVLLRVHCERRRTVFVVGARAASDPLLTDAPQATRAAEPIRQVYDLDGLFSGVYRPSVGDAPISPGASLWISVYNHVYILLTLAVVGVDDLAGLRGPASFMRLPGFYLGLLGRAVPRGPPYGRGTGCRYEWTGLPRSGVGDNRAAHLCGVRAGGLWG